MVFLILLVFLSGVEFMVTCSVLGSFFGSNLFVLWVSVTVCLSRCWFMLNLIS